VYTHFETANPNKKELNTAKEDKRILHSLLLSIAAFVYMALRLQTQLLSLHRPTCFAHLTQVLGMIKIDTSGEKSHPIVRMS